MYPQYNIKRVINYRTTHNQNFDDEFVKELKLKMPDMVYVYSQNSASSLLKFIKFIKFSKLLKWILKPNTTSTIHSQRTVLIAFLLDTVFGSSKV